MNPASTRIAPPGHNLSFVKSMLLRQTDALRQRERTAAEALCRRGAILTLADEPDQRYLVGHLRWQGDRGLAVFIAFGEGPRDVRRLVPDDITLERDGSVSLLCNQRGWAKLQSLEVADFEDADDYRIAWQLWQQVAPLHAALIERSYAEFAPPN